MALIKCKECGAEISDAAEACPKCGKPVPVPNLLKSKIGAKEIIISICIGVGVIWWMAHDSNFTNNTENQECKPDDLQCVGAKLLISADVYCKDDIERFAKHGVKWTDSTFEHKFSRLRWADQTKGEITFVGDKVEFQNGFGAYTPITYECTLSSDGKTVLNADIVGEGRLQKQN